jgi:hypothetical protein
VADARGELMDLEDRPDEELERVKQELKEQITTDACDASNSNAPLPRQPKAFAGTP